VASRSGRTVAGPRSASGERIVRLGHISDLHVADRGRYPRNGFTAKDCEKHSAKLAKGLLDALREVNVDHLVVTGDVTFSAEPREFERVADLLRPFAEA
jgi:3',5'-cyclic AMP phosphodiesterase CpdA